MKGMNLLHQVSSYWLLKIGPPVWKWSNIRHWGQTKNTHNTLILWKYKMYQLFNAVFLLGYAFILWTYMNTAHTWKYMLENVSCPMVKQNTFPFPTKPITVYNICETAVYEVLTVINIITIAVLWDVTTHNLVTRYPQSQEICCFSSLTCFWRQWVPLKCWYVSTRYQITWHHNPEDHSSNNSLCILKEQG